MMDWECKFCRMTFTKGEHLRRHERTHTGAKPFQCKICKRAFSRQDSLMRHERLHTRDQFNSSSSIAIISTPIAVSHPITPESLNSIDEVAGQATGTSLLAVHTPSLTAPNEGGFELIWPDSEDLFQNIISSDWTINQPPFTDFCLDTAQALDPALGVPNTAADRSETMTQILTGENQRAVKEVSSMISSLSSSVTAAAEATSLSSVFLDECLHMFFVRFIPTFPILHRATFVFKDCKQQLLLNAIAIGSLYLGPKDAAAKGEALWHLAHTAIATSWQSLISHRGPYDAVPGVQLILSALLSQVYGALSRNRSIRTTSQAFRALNFFWARRCGMMDVEAYDINQLPSHNASAEEKDYQWRLWAAREIQQRTLLAHFILDGLTSSMTGEPTSTRHATSKLTIPSCECAFEASTADDWITHMQTLSAERPSFRHLLRVLFKPSIPSPFTDHTFTAFSFRVLLEGLQSLLADCDAEASAVGVPTRAEVEAALSHFQQSLMANPHISNSDRQETILRWHTICLDTIVDSSLLCRQLCTTLNVEQHLWKGPKEAPTNFDIFEWVSSNNARRALLHAIAIQEIVEQLPRGRAHAIHMPSSLFSAATIYATFSVATVHTVKVPMNVAWHEVLLDLEQPYFTLAEMSNPAMVSDTVKFVRGEPFFGLGMNRNLLYELNSIQKLFRCLYSQWGIAYDMESVVDHWVKVCR